MAANPSAGLGGPSGASARQRGSERPQRASLSRSLPLKPLHLFRGGTQTSMQGVTRGYDVSGIAASYDPALHEAPLVIGHPSADDPAYGWIASLSTDGDSLFGESQQVDATFAEAVEAGRYKKISVSFYLENSPAHPVRVAGGEPTAPYLRHVGFLGAQVPAVKGLNAVQFSEAEEGVVTVEFAEDGPPDAPAWTVRGLIKLFRRLRSHIASTDGEETAERVLPESEIDYALEDLAREEGAHYERARKTSPAFAEPDEDVARSAPTDSPTNPPDMAQDPKDQNADFAEREAALTTREQELADREQKIKDQEAEATRKGHLEFAEGLANDGARILPRHVPVVAGVLDRLTGVAASETVEFGEGDTAEQLGASEALRKMLGELPMNVDFGEVSAPEPGGDGATVEFAAPQGYDVDAGRLAIHQKALDYQASHDVDYVTAVQAVN